MNQESYQFERSFDNYIYKHRLIEKNTMKKEKLELYDITLITLLAIPTLMQILFIFSKLGTKVFDMAILLILSIEVIPFRIILPLSSMAGIYFFDKKWAYYLSLSYGGLAISSFKQLSLEGDIMVQFLIFIAIIIISLIQLTKHSKTETDKHTLA